MVGRWGGHVFDCPLHKLTPTCAHTPYRRDPAVCVRVRVCALRTTPEHTVPYRPLHLNTPPCSALYTLTHCHLLVIYRPPTP